MISGKTIYIVSPQDWGLMFLSKHHYAVELAKQNNDVYFFNSPDMEKKYKRGEVKLLDSGVENLKIISYRLFLPYFFRFKFPKLYDFLVKIQIWLIVRKIKKKPDIIWSFDLLNSLPLKSFYSGCKKIFMPVDDPGLKLSIDAAIGSDLIISVTEDILEKYASKVPKILISHGVSSSFINERINTCINDPIKIGYSGSLLRKDVDRNTLLKILKENSNVIFEFWGECDYNNSFLELAKYKNTETLAFIEELKSLKNVVLHGVVNTNTLAEGLKKMDAFLICYNVPKSQNKSSNSHKILEYLATGKVIIANYYSSYKKNNVDLFEMVDSTDNNNQLPALFLSIINNLAFYNSEVKQKQRINFAKQSTYSSQIKRIESYLKDVK